MSTTAKLYLQAGLNYIPQMDFATQETENGGIEATQSFLIKKADVGVGAALINFRRGTRLEVVDPFCPALYRNLTVKSTPITDHAPGIMRVEATFTGYAYSSGSGSSGEPQTVPTYSLAGNLEEAPLNEHKKWAALSKNEKLTLGKILSGLWHWTEDPFTPGQYVVANETGDGWNVRTSASEQITSENGKFFAQIISENKVTFKKPSWSHNVRENATTGFTSAQLATLGMIVANPPGNPEKPPGGYTWLSMGPSQEQSGPDLFYKDLPFLLIEDNEENRFLYGD